MARSPKYVPVYFAPDKDPSWNVNPGVLTDVRNLVPTVRGTLANYAATAAENFTAVTPLVTAIIPNTAKIMRRVGVIAGSGSARLIIGGDSDLLEPVGAVLTNVSSAPGAYGALEWALDAFGDSMLAAGASVFLQPSSRIQRSTGAAGTLFADLPNSPRCAITVVQRGFVLAFNCYDGTNWYSDGWMCSGLQNPTSWCADFTAPANVTTQANYGRVYETSGGWRAAHRMRDGIAAYKEDSLYLGRYTGPITSSAPNTWSFTLVSDRMGVGNHNAVAIVNGVHYFVHRTGVYRFDGSYPQNIGVGRVNRWLQERISRSSLYTLPGLRSQVNEEESTITWWFLASALASGKANTIINAGLVYNYVTDSWGFIDRPWDEQGPQTSLRYFLAPVQASRAELGAWTASFPVDGRRATQLSVGQDVTAGTVFLRGAVVGQSSRGTDTTSVAVTGDLGDDVNYSRVDEVKPRLLASDDEGLAGACYVDAKESQAHYYRHEGVMLVGSAAAAAAGDAYVRMLPPDVGLGASSGRVILAGDFMSFQATLLAGALTTPVGLRVTFTDASVATFTTTFAKLDRTVSVSLTMAAHAGKTLSLVQAYFGNAVGAGVHRAVIRNVRITDAAGANQLRLRDQNDLIYINAGATVGLWTNWAGLAAEDVKSYGREFAHDPLRRRFQGNATGRVLRARLELPNRVDLGGLSINVAAAEGTE